MITPDYYEKFRCIGSECQHNCCMGEWDIEVDDEARARFDKINGDFGERVRASVNDENVFIRKNGKCPLLSSDGLCEMVLNGHKLCIICDEYPRFTEFYGDYTERGISLSCEAASKIILDNENKVTLTGETGECCEDIFNLLYGSRNDIFQILQDRAMSVSSRIRLVLDYGEKLQGQINNNDYSAFEYVPVDRLSNGKDNTSVFEFLSELDYLSDDWCDILRNHREYVINNEIQVEQLAVYFVYRYFLKAVFDCDALSKLKLMAISVIAITSLKGDIYENSRRYSVEVEHSEDNVEMIYDEFLFNEDFSTENIINMIK